MPQCPIHTVKALHHSPASSHPCSQPCSQPPHPVYPSHTSLSASDSSPPQPSPAQPTTAPAQVLFALASETMGFLCALASPDSKVGIILISMLLIILLSFSGYLVASVPVYFSWVGKISFLSYAQAALVENEFRGLVLYQAGQPVDAIAALPSGAVNGLSVGGNVAVLLGMVVGMRVLAFVAMEVQQAMRRRRTG